MRRRHWCFVDRHTLIVVRNNKAVTLGIVQFAIFDALHRAGAREGKQMPSAKLCDEVYRGVKNPSTLQTLHSCVAKMNRKLAHLGLVVRGVSRKQNSFYQIVLAKPPTTG